jgi:hypothetical protein
MALETTGDLGIWVLMKTGGGTKEINVAIQCGDHRLNVFMATGNHTNPTGETTKTGDDLILTTIEVIEEKTAETIREIAIAGEKDGTDNSTVTEKPF